MPVRAFVSEQDSSHCEELGLRTLKDAPSAQSTILFPGEQDILAAADWGPHGTQVFLLKHEHGAKSVSTGFSAKAQYTKSGKWFPCCCGASTYEYSPELESSKENKPKTDYQDSQERHDTCGEEDCPENPTYRCNEN
jgi:hypothetical protein